MSTPGLASNGTLGIDSSLSVRTYPVFPGKYTAPRQIGKWIVLVEELEDHIPLYAKLCVVDDFGNLVATSS